MDTLALASLAPLIALIAVQAGWNTRVRVLFALATVGPPALFLNAFSALSALISLEGLLLAGHLSVLVVITTAQLWFLTPPTSRTLNVEPRLTLTACNVLLSNIEIEQLSRTLLNEHPDVLVLSEVFDEKLSRLAPMLLPLIPIATGGHPGFAPVFHAEHTPIEKGLDVVVFVRPGLIWTPATHVSAGDRCFPCISLPDLDLTICSAHTTSPHRPNDPREWRTQLRALATRAGTSAEPFIVAGDLNASFRHAPLRTSNLKPASRSWLPTWPSRLPLLELDHVLTSNCRVVDVSRCRAPGSDHFGITARIG